MDIQVKFDISRVSKFDTDEDISDLSSLEGYYITKVEDDGGGSVVLSLSSKPHFEKIQDTDTGGALDTMPEEGRADAGKIAKQLKSKVRVE